MLLVASLTVAALAAAPASAGSFRIHNGDDATSIEVLVSCFDGSGEPQNFTFRPGDVSDVSQEKCDAFEIKFATQGVRHREDYTVRNGERIRLFWNNTHWDAEPE